MKLAFCIFKYYPYGGLSRDFTQIIEICQQRKHIIDVYTMHWEGIIPKNLNVVLVSSHGFTNHSRCASFVENLSNIIRNQNYTTIIGFNRMPGLDLYYAGDVCYEYAVIHRYGALFRLSSRYKTYSAFEQTVFAPEGKTHIMYRSEMLKRQYMEYYHTPEERFHLLKPGIDITRKAPENAEQIGKQIRQVYNITDQQQLILLIGSNYKLKGVDRALTALASLPKDLGKNTLLWIIGKGKEHSFKRHARSLGIASRVKFLGTRDNIPELLLAADLLLHPARREATGGVILEAIVAGLPVIATADCGFANHIQKAHTGLVVPKPFDQAILNKFLRDTLITQRHQEWRKNALIYGQTQDLYGHSDVVDVIEKNDNKL